MNNILEAYNIVPEAALAAGYNLQTTYWGDFTVADRLGGASAVKDTYQRALELAKSNKIYGTELALVLNWKIWEHCQRDENLARVYDKLWRELDGYILDHWKKEDLDYYLKTTD